MRRRAAPLVMTSTGQGYFCDGLGDLFDVDQSSAGRDIDQQVDVGCLGGGAAGDRAEHAHVGAAEPSGSGDDLVPNGERTRVEHFAP